MRPPPQSVMRCRLPSMQRLVLAGGHADPHEHRAPERRARGRCQRELPVVESHDAGGDADQVPDHGEDARDERSHRAVVRGPGLRALDLVRRDRHVAAVAHEQRPAQQAREPVHRARADPRAQRARDHDAGERERAARVREVGGRRDDELARHGKSELSAAIRMTISRYPPWSRAPRYQCNSEAMKSRICGCPWRVPPRVPAGSAAWHSARSRCPGRGRIAVSEHGV